MCAYEKCVLLNNYSLIIVYGLKRKRVCMRHQSYFTKCKPYFNKKQNFVKIKLTCNIIDFRCVL